MPFASEITTMPRRLAGLYCRPRAREQSLSTDGKLRPSVNSRFQVDSLLMGTEIHKYYSYRYHLVIVFSWSVSSVVRFGRVSHEQLEHHFAYG